MAIPRWKRLASHLVEWELETVSTPVHPKLTVSLVRGRVQLFADKAIYSFEDLYANFAVTFRRLDLDRLPGRKVLVLGLGLGSVIQMLETEHHLQGEYVAVEIDEVIARLAQSYVLDGIRAQVTVLTTDARIFLCSAGEDRYDLIIQDIFLDDRIPDFFSGAESLAMLKGRLNPGGLLLSNRLYRTEADKIRTKAYIRDVVLPLFPKTTSIIVEGNLVLIQDPSYLKSS